MTDAKLRKNMVQALLEVLDEINAGDIQAFAFVGTGPKYRLLMRGEATVAEMMGLLENAKMKLWFQSILDHEADALEASPDAWTALKDIGKPN